MLDCFLLILGFFFTFFLTGFVFIENFFPELPLLLKLPSYFILSIIISTYLIYFLSLFLGFSRFSILIGFGLIFIWFLFYLIKTKKAPSIFPKEHKEALVLSFLVFLVYFISLYPAIFKEYHGYIVMAGPNWQDTALHLGIIQSLTQGNFPPQAPYFAGKPLHYYYFVDFHSAILSTLFGRFFPRILVYDNPFFAAIFSLTVYSLAFYLTKKKGISLASAFVSTFFSNYYFFTFLREIFQNKERLSLIKKILFLLRNNSYSLEFGKLFQMANMADYFLQNRAMMLALPTIVLVFYLIIYAFLKKSLKIIFLAGLISGALVKFQLFGFLVSFIIFNLILIFYFSKKELRFYFKSIFIFYFLVLIFFFGNRGPFPVALAIKNLSFGPWEKGKSFFWHLKFVFANLGSIFFLNSVAFILGLVEVLKKRPIKKEFFLLFFISLFLFSIPYLISFTIYSGDMFKFFYFLIPFSTILTFWFLSFFRGKIFVKFIFVLIIITSVFGSFLTLTHSFINKTGAYSLEDLKVGLWIRENTPKKSIFITYPTVHSAVDQIGGRLRILSYPFWPHSHGYIFGEDNVYKRVEDVENLYKNSDNEEIVLRIMEKYKADFLFYGQEEKINFPEAEENFEKISKFKKVYDTGGVKIWKRVK